MNTTYQPNTHEQKIYALWEKGGYFAADPNSSKPAYGILMPPPNVTGSLHIGHAMEQSIMDALARFKRMQGFDVLLLPGVDHAGIQFEGTLNKILEKKGTPRQKIGREKWMKQAWQFKDEIYNSFHHTWKAFGLSADWSREVFTMDPKVANSVLEEFKTFWEQDLLYKGAYIVQWCPKDQTAIEDLEMEYEERKVKLYFVKYQMEETSEYIVVATTRPETIYADTGIAIYPNHPQFGKFVGKNAINPLTDTKIPIIEDKRVDKKFGTGAVKMTPGHNSLDFAIGKDHNLPILHAVDKTGKMTELAEGLVGIKAEEARKQVEERLQKSGNLERVEDYTHSVPVCERCKTVVEPLISEEWFVKMQPLAQKALANINKVNFVPKNYLKILSTWIQNIHDWSISRSLWWGHRIPVWYCQKSNPNHLVGKDQDLIISLEKPTTECPTCGLTDWVQDEQVLDTWFSSGLWPMTTLGWPKQNKELDKYYPWDFETSAPEIKFLWIARMIMLGLWFKDEIPFKNQFFHGMLRDLQGRKFSKSLGNGIDPYELVQQWGVDATRMALYTYSIPGRDGRTSKQLIDERAKNFRNFANKVWNIARFILSQTIPDHQPNFEHKDDKWILEELKKATTSITTSLAQFRLHDASQEAYDFIWHTVADAYIEKTKNRREKAQPVLVYLLQESLKLLHPFMPFVTETIWQIARQQNNHYGSSARGSAKPSSNQYFLEKSLIIAHWPAYEK